MTAGPPAWTECDPEPLYDQEVTDLYLEFADQVYRFARRGLAHEDAEEVTNSSFLAARLHWERVRKFDLPAGYVFRAAHHLRADALARMARHAARVTDDRDQADLAASPPAIGHEERLDLRQALSRLSHREEQVAVLYYWAGLPTREIADVLQISTGNVSRTLSDARIKLRLLLTAEPGTRHRDNRNGATDE